MPFCDLAANAADQRSLGQGHSRNHIHWHDLCGAEPKLGKLLVADRRIPRHWLSSFA